VGCGCPEQQTRNSLRSETGRALIATALHSRYRLDVDDDSDSLRFRAGRNDAVGTAARA